MTENEETILSEALKYFGGDAQVMKALEEMSELSVELHHYLCGRGEIDKMREELADCLVILTQVRELLGIHEVDTWIAYKTERLAKRIGATA